MLKWYHWVLFYVVVIIALSMSWYSMTDLATTGFDLPWILSAGVSLAFDIGAIWLGMMAIEYAKTSDSGLWPELWAFVFVFASVYINVQHALVNDYGVVGMVMFGAAPVIAGVMFKVMLSFITRHQRRTSGTLVARLPRVGLLTWFRYHGQTWQLMSIAMQKRLVDAADKLDMPEDRHAIFVGQAKVQEDIIDIPELALSTVDNPDVGIVHNPDFLTRTEKDIDDIVYIGEVMSIPEWLPKEPTMSLAKIAEVCVQNGISNVNNILTWTRLIKGSDIQYGSMYKAVQRAKQKV